MEENKTDITPERMKMMTDCAVKLARAYVGKQVMLIPVIESRFVDSGYKPFPVKGYVTGVTADGVMEIDESDSERDGEIMSRRMHIVERREECGTVAWLTVRDNDTDDDEIELDLSDEVAA